MASTLCSTAVSYLHITRALHCTVLVPSPVRDVMKVVRGVGEGLSGCHGVPTSLARPYVFVTLKLKQLTVHQLFRHCAATAFLKQLIVDCATY